ncbi:MAG: hypothetical protein JSU70_07035 [Phycisphaerales bacterium]|nr:MAG: hypothetical protein JSU70_07035 [Phycisphaerales bacterium]
MVFRYYTNAVSQASRRIAAGIFIVGLLLVGFGTIIAALPEIFAYLAAAVFFAVGVGSCITAVKIFLAQKRLDQADSNGPRAYRTNVRIRTEEYSDQ